MDLFDRLSREGLLPQNVFFSTEYLKCTPRRPVDSSFYSSHLWDDTLTWRDHIKTNYRTRQIRVQIPVHNSPRCIILGKWLIISELIHWVVEGIKWAGMSKVAGTQHMFRVVNSIIITITGLDSFICKWLRMNQRWLKQKIRVCLIETKSWNVPGPQGTSVLVYTSALFSFQLPFFSSPHHWWRKPTSQLQSWCASDSAPQEGINTSPFVDFTFLGKESYGLTLNLMLVSFIQLWQGSDIGGGRGHRYMTAPSTWGSLYWWGGRQRGRALGCLREKIIMRCYRCCRRYLPMKMGLLEMWRNVWNVLCEKNPNIAYMS